MRALQSAHAWPNVGKLGAKEKVASGPGELICLNSFVYENKNRYSSWVYTPCLENICFSGETEIYFLYVIELGLKSIDPVKMPRLSILLT